MKIAISSLEDNMNSKVSAVFGRCPYFIIVEVKDKKIGKTEIMKNKSAEQRGGAGISAAQAVAEKDVKAVITGNIGPNALNVLKQFKIDIYLTEGSIKETLPKFIKGKLSKLKEE